MPDSNSYNATSKYGSIFRGLPEDFERKAIGLFNEQFRLNTFYRRFAGSFIRSAASVTKISQIPFLPVSFFKTEEIRTGSYIPETVFQSSGTTGQQNASHFVKDLNLYRESFMRGFETFYGQPGEYCILGLLPAYLERTGSSLVMMVHELIQATGHSSSGFYLYDFEKLHLVLKELEKNKQKTLLIGVSFALLDFAEQYPMQLSHTTIMETGGMKGRRKEITREALHNILKNQLGVTSVHSEYGMTELLSQAYSGKDGVYIPVPWMKVLTREEDDPLQVSEVGQGLLNVIDLANRDSCAFLATDDVVKIHQNGYFEVLGRMDNSDVRGCSLLVV